MPTSFYVWQYQMIFIMGKRVMSNRQILFAGECSFCPCRLKKWRIEPLPIDCRYGEPFQKGKYNGGFSRSSEETPLGHRVMFGIQPGSGAAGL